MVLLPLWPIIAVAIKLEDGGPVFFGHHRVGKGEEPFVTRKFRSMPVENTVTIGEGRPDPADITAVGRILRSTALDESPQLWDVLRGRMSLVGPRPLMVEQVERGLAGERGPDGGIASPPHPAGPSRGPSLRFAASNPTTTPERETASRRRPRPRRSARRPGTSGRGSSTTGSWTCTGR